MDTKILKQVAALAKLDVPEEKIVELAEEFSQIVAYVEQMNSAPVDADAKTGKPTPVLQRSDVVTPGLSREAAFANAPESDQHTFLVPLVLE